MKRFLGAALACSALACSAVAVVGAAAPASAAGSFYAPALPWSTSGAPSTPWTASISECFGGSRCGGSGSALTVQTPATWIGTVGVRAHDRVGDTTKATLFVLVDGAQVGAVDVKAAGETHYFAVGRVGSEVRLVAAASPSSWSDEIVVSGVLVTP
ncbi:hypothetical protein KCV87_11840 [Actinosynnema pretiosum subsp. pretiosum]|uniref:Secreted protein n=1 Tax=Actinosynnema pretiosum subsp. pretiosum TaxID=103721 RepID=A0AA45R6F7_9PSEU|nr:hypothetical protein APASM_1680 [Actinosynnema pretiosum subsp. pretiosum]QUF06675.1 hypothetical protein KCV87_11840 [Actinosynnema pretiosum subsp. pretiosum]